MIDLGRLEIDHGVNTTAKSVIVYNISLFAVNKTTKSVVITQKDDVHSKMVTPNKKQHSLLDSHPSELFWTNQAS